MILLRALPALATAALSTIAGPVLAEETPDTREPDAGEDVLPDVRGFELGLRLGWAIPQGESYRGTDLAQTVHGAIPIWLDVGYRVLPPLVLGLYAQYAYVIVSGCASACHSSDVRFGLQAQWHFGERRATSHWIGLGAGYEILAEEVETNQGATLERTLSGFEFLNLQLGEDLPLGHGFSLGPFLSMSLGKFLSDTGPREISAASGEIPNPSFHVWVVLGARLGFGT